MLDIRGDYCWGGSIETVTRVPHPTCRNHGMPRQGLTQGHVRRRESHYVRVCIRIIFARSHKSGVSVWTPIYYNP